MVLDVFASLTCVSFGRYKCRAPTVILHGVDDTCGQTVSMLAQRNADKAAEEGMFYHRNTSYRTPPSCARPGAVSRLGKTDDLVGSHAETPVHSLHLVTSLLEHR